VKQTMSREQYQYYKNMFHEGHAVTIVDNTMLSHEISPFRFRRMPLRSTVKLTTNKSENGNIHGVH
jgi:hypothetical protein